jgi:hypothetical protein
MLIVVALLAKIGVFSLAVEGMAQAAPGNNGVATDSQWWPLPPGS